MAMIVLKSINISFTSEKRKARIFPGFAVFFIVIFFSILCLVDNFFFLGSIGSRGGEVWRGGTEKTAVSRFWAYFPLGRIRTLYFAKHTVL